MVIFEQRLWVIMSKDRKHIVKGVPRNRYIVEVDDVKDKKRIMTYKTKGLAEAAFKNFGFFNQQSLTGYPKGTMAPHNYEEFDLGNYLEAVECNMTIQD